MRSIIPCALSALVCSHAAVGQEEIVIKNDSVVDGSEAFVCPCFIGNEIGAAVLTPPDDLFPLRVKRVQIFWKSFQGSSPQVLGSAILLWEGGLPQPGDLLLELIGPLMTDGFLNEFDIDFFQIDLMEPTSFMVGFEFDPKFPSLNDPFAGTLIVDADGCQPGKNAVFAIPGGWQDLCALGGSGDWVIRAVVEPLAPPPCVGDFNGDGTLSVLDFIDLQSAFAAQDPSADINQDGEFDVLDFIVFQSAFAAGCP